ncbi:hypothetical protein BDZ97DRAFT_1734303 [Flammula alnicola]|nr:hypothetical protein BDZ97DRAFT_1734303 [Flammula alnicola]
MRTRLTWQPALTLVNLLLQYISSTGVRGNTWCGKNYEIDQPIIPPKGTFPPSEDLKEPEFAFRCVPRNQPYLKEDDCRSYASVLVDTLITPVHLRHGSPMTRNNPVPTTLTVTLEVDGYLTVYRDVEMNAKDLELPLSLCSLRPHRTPYNITCSAELEVSTTLKQTVVYTTSLWYLPTPPSGSVTKLDRKTGALMTKSNAGNFEHIFPIGFYTDFGGYLASNLTILDEIKSQGFTVVHPVPPFTDKAAFDEMLDHMDAIGLYLIYDMRHSYQNLHAVSQEVEALKRHKSLLLWYTADEPDGSGDALDATRAAYDLIYELDGYHPVSIALNCADYFFEEYVSGADIILPDVYMIGNNATFSSKYSTPCTKDFGCCGCDNCEGQFEDISKRLHATSTRLRMLGWDKTKFIWTVTQAFGGEEFWTRPPTGREWLVQTILSINHGTRGIIPWIDPTPVDIKQYASLFAKALSQLVPYFFDPETSFSHSTYGRVDVGLWRRGPKTLILATNLDGDNFGTLIQRLDNQTISWILQEGTSMSSDRELVLEPLGSAIVVISKPQDILDSKRPEHDEL